MGYNDTSVFAVGGEDDGATLFTVTPYSAVGGFASDWGFAPASALTVPQTVTFSPDRAAIGFGRSESDASPAGWAMFAFGGVDPTGTVLSTTARYNYATRSWTLLNYTGASPSARSLASGVFLPRCANTTGSIGPASSCFIVLGGLSPAGARLAGGSVLYVDGAGTTRPYWYTPPTMGTNAPPALHSAAVAAGLDGNDAYVFGGDTATGVSNGLYVLAPQGFSPPKPSEMNNIAYHMPVAASSSDPIQGGYLSISGTPPNRWSVAVDGITAGITNPAPNAANVNNAVYNLCTSTIRGGAQPINGMLIGTVDPWFMVDLGANDRRFDGVQFFSRTDCLSSNNGNIFPSIDCYTRNAGFRIAYGNDASSPTSPNNFNPDSGPNAAQYACVNLPNDLSGGSAFVWCPGASGRYVWVYLPGANRVLVVCELQVLTTVPWTWRALSAGGTAVVEVAKGKAASQTSVLYDNNSGAGSDARLAVDGQTANNW